MIKKKLISTILTTVFISTNIFANQLKKPTIDFTISAFSLKEEALLSRGSATVIDGHFGYLIDENLKINLEPVVSFISGQQTSRDPQSPLTNSLYLNEASVEYNPSPLFMGRVGSLYQKDFLPGLAGYAKSFPALAVKVPVEILKDQLIEINLEAAVPTSSGLATNVSELESSTSLFAGTLNYTSVWSEHLTTKFSISHFVFNGLSSATVADSIPKGNTLIKVNSTSYIYAYKYSGNEAKINFDLLIIPNVGVNFDGSFIKNQLAPTDLNSGYFVSLSIPIKIKSNDVFKPFIEHFRVESDAMVATFLDTRYGRTNRDGYRYGIELERSNYNLQAIYAESKLIQINPFQSGDKSFFINLSINNITL